MLENFGPIQHVALAALWWLLLFPFAGGAVILFFGLGWLVERRDDPKADPPDARTIDRVALATFGLTFAASLVFAYQLYQRAPSERFLLTHLLQMVRVGQLDVHLDLVLDPLSSLLVVVVTGIATIATAMRAHETDSTTNGKVAPPETWRFHAWSVLLVGGTLLALLADGPLFVVVGWQAAGASLFGLAGDNVPRATVLHRAGDAAIVIAVAVLFWSLGGTWSDTEFTPDLTPRYVSVSSAGAPGARSVGTVKVDFDDDDDRPHARPSSSAKGTEPVGGGVALPRTHATVTGSGPTLSGKGLLTLASTPGALVYVDDSHTPLLAGDQPVRAPFARREIPGGMHTFRVHAGAGLDDYIVAHVPVGGDADTWLVLVGPTVTFRELRDQLVLENVRGEAWVRDALRSKKVFGGVSSLTLACLLFVFGVAARGASMPLHVAQVKVLAHGSFPAASVLLFSLTTLVLPTYLLARVSFLFPSSPIASTCLVVLGALTALGCGASATFSMDRARARAFVSVGVSGVLLIALGTGAFACAVVAAVVHALAMASLAADDALGARAEPRTAMAAVGALVVSLVAAMTTAAMSEGLSPVPSLVVAVAGILATASFAGVLRTTSAPQALEKPKADNAKRKRNPPRWVPAALALAALVVTALGLGTRAVGGTGESLLAASLAPAFDTARVHFDHEPAAAVGLGVGGLALAFIAWLRSPRRTNKAPSGFGAHAAAGFHADALFDHALTPLALASSSVAAEVDRRVIDGLVHAVAVLVRAGAWVQRRVDRAVVDAPGEAIADGIEPLVSNHLEETESPRAQSAGYAVFGLLLLASLVLYVVSNR